MENTFGINIIPENDQERTEVLKRYKILDSPPERAFDNLAHLAAQIFSVPVCLISLVDTDKVFFKANVGMGDTKSAPRGSSLCSLAILNTELTIFEDTRTEACLLTNPLVAGNFGLQFYAGAPLITDDGFAIGTICLVDKQPRKFSKKEEEILKGLGRIVMDEIELRLSAIHEIEQQQFLNEELTATIEELAAANEELLITNEELADTHQSLRKIINELAESEDRFRNMIEQAPVAMLIFKGEEMIFDIVNPYMLNLLDKTAAIIGKPFLQVLPEIAGQPIEAIMQEVYQTGKPYYGFDVPMSLNRKGVQETGYFNFAYTPLIENGIITGILQVVTEITEGIKIRKELQKAEEMLRFSIEAANVGTWFIDVKTQEFSPSASMKKLFGFGASEEMSYMDVVDLITEEYRNKVVASVASTISKGKKFNIECSINGRKDQKVRWLKAIGKVENDAEGKLSHFSGVIFEITEQKQDEIRKNDFIAMVSHELKTPLTSLKGYMQLLMLKNQNADSFTTMALEKGNAQVRKMTAMITSFLNVSRLEAGKIHLEKQDFQLNELMNEIVEEIQMTTQSHHIILADCEQITINADLDKIGQVITNFLSNAVKYSPNGQNIEIQCRQKGNVVQVSVTDEGMGIKQEDLEKLFDRFYRVDTQLAQNISGFGIGLYLCAEIIRRHNGNIWVESEIGKGSTFHFSVPLN